MAFEAVYSLGLTTDRLAESCRVSIESPSRKILESARYGVNTATNVLNFLKDLKNKSVFSEMRKVLEGETRKAMEQDIKKAASELEYVLDCHVSDQFLSQSETGDERRRPLLFSLDLQGVEQDIDGFAQKMKKLRNLFFSWYKDEEDNDLELFMSSVSFQPSATRTKLINWLAFRATSTFLGMEAGEYVQELDNLLPYKEEEEDDEKYCDYYIKRELDSWWANKAASAFMMDRQEVDSPLPEDEEKDDYSASSRTVFAENMVGVTDKFCEIRDGIIGKSDEFRFTSIYGMAGIGKTALAMKIFEDPLISSTFESRIFVRIGQKYKIENIVQDILAQVNPDSKRILTSLKMAFSTPQDEYLYKIFKAGKVLVVLDDVWDEVLICYLRLKFPLEEVFGCHFLMTTRLRVVANYQRCTMYSMRFLNNRESWDLLQEKVFVGEAFPRELEKAGKQIAENCEGLPLLIITVAHLLSKAEKTPEYWSKIAASKKNSIFIDAYEKISEVLYPSYSYLPQHLKTCFLYLGAFPQNCEVRISKLINLWSAEGFVGCSNSYRFLGGLVENYFCCLVRNSVALDTHRSSYNYFGLKVSSLHSVFWYLSKKEAWNEKFLHVLDSYADASVQDIESRRRLSVYKNSIFSIKVARHSIASISSLRSLLCTGPYHPYQVPMCFDLRLLKVLDALTIRFYEFPVEVVKLVLLRYIVLTCNGNLPPSVSKLWALQCLIIHQHLSIKTSISESYVPVEIWDLLELQYLQIMGRNLPDPPHGVVLTKLMILLDVGAHTCTKHVFQSIPNLYKLRVRIELMPDAAEPLGFLDEISLLKELSSLQCVIVNPELMLEVVPLAPLVSASSLTSLTLSGFGYHWKDIQIIAELPFLRVLKLRCYAFRGEEWEVGETKFRSLQYFSVEDTDLVEWTAGSKNFPALEYLNIKNCYKLQEIPQIPSVREIQLVDCNPSAVTIALFMLSLRGWILGTSSHDRQFVQKLLC